MPDLERPNGDAPASVELRVAETVDIDLDAARTALTDLEWLGARRDGPQREPGVRRIATDLELPIRDGSAPRPVRKAALIDLGPPREEEHALVLTVAWHSATAAPLFPVFVGELRVARTGLVLEGRYVPPFGRIGLVIDGALLRVVARRTAQAFLGRIAAKVGI